MIPKGISSYFGDLDNVYFQCPAFKEVATIDLVTDHLPSIYVWITKARTVQCRFKYSKMDFVRF